MTKFQMWCVLCNTFNVLRKNSVPLDTVERYFKDKKVLMNSGAMLNYHDKYLMSLFDFRDINYCLHLMGVSNTMEASFNKQKSKGIVINIK